MPHVSEWAQHRCGGLCSAPTNVDNRQGLFSIRWSRLYRIVKTLRRNGFSLLLNPSVSSSFTSRSLYAASLTATGSICIVAGEYTVMASPLSRPPPGGDIHDGRQLEVGATVTFICASIAVGLRTFTRAKYTHLAWDDYLMLVAVVKPPVLVKSSYSANYVLVTSSGRDGSR